MSDNRDRIYTACVLIIGNEILSGRTKDSNLGWLAERLNEAGIGIQEVDLQRDLVEKKLQVSITATCPEHVDMDKLSRAFSAIPDVEKVEID